jgi:hypothetical protein
VGRSWLARADGRGNRYVQLLLGHSRDVPSREVLLRVRCANLETQHHRGVDLVGVSWGW